MYIIRYLEFPLIIYNKKQYKNHTNENINRTEPEPIAEDWES